MEQKRKVLAIDIETYSPIDIKRSGVYVYAADAGFEVLLFAYAFDADPVVVVDLASGEELSGEVLAALIDPEVVKTAYNAAFERTCLSRMVGLEMPAEQWQCTMVRAAMVGFPFGLDAVAKAMGIEQGKMSQGKALIRYFCVPCRGTKSNGGRVRNLYSDDLEKWATFKEYCARDVEVERVVRERADGFMWGRLGMEPELWALDQRINDRGVGVDGQFVTRAIEMGGCSRAELIEEATSMTGLTNANSASQMKGWLSQQIGSEVDSLTKESIKEMLGGDHSDEVMRVLELRGELSKTSVKKYEAMASAVGRDGRIRGLLQFYGASRTGRWAGRLVQVQNLPQNHIVDLDLARGLVRGGDRQTLALCYGNVADTLSQLIRTAFVAGDSAEDRFIVADFSAIEARVIAWLADERWRQEVFATHGKIYEASASAMFGVPIGQVTKGSSLRQKGKVAELALGYQGGAGALVAMGALRMGLVEDELPSLVEAWRGANRAIVRLWGEVNAAAIRAIKNREMVVIRSGVRFYYTLGALYVELPSGRRLVYQQARLGTNRFGGESITYCGMDQQTRQWGAQETYGGKLVENIVQAIARDCLGEAMVRLDNAGYSIVMHVHDEVVVEARQGNTLEKACRIMGEPLNWAPGLLLRADGYETPYYKKD